MPAEPVDDVVDTTGAGDLFAAGFLSGLIQDQPLAIAARMGCICAGEVLRSIGPRSDASLKDMVAARLATG
jgi:sugar/nucleoside kinase (ribokinase family)